MPNADVSERLFRLETGSHCTVTPEPVQEEHYVYMACCANGALYTGYTTQVEQRIAAHNAGVGGRYTRSNRPIVLVALWRFNSRTEALHAERSIKRLSHGRKLALAENAVLAQGERL